MPLRYRGVWKVLSVAQSSGCNFMLSLDWGWDLGTQEEPRDGGGQRWGSISKKDGGQSHKISSIMKSHKISHSYHVGELILRQKLLTEFDFLRLLASSGQERGHSLLQAWMPGEKGVFESEVPKTKSESMAGLRLKD